MTVLSPENAICDQFQTYESIEGIVIITVFIPWTPNILFHQSKKIVREPGLTMKTL